MDRYINIHTHRAGNAAALEIVSCYEHFERCEEEMPCSVGLHPWYLDAGTLDADMDHLRSFAGRQNVLAIGECGLDKLTKTDWELQLRAFALQIALANECNKPLIIHCVRAYDELLAVFREHMPLVPVILHGFSKKPVTAAKMLAAGCYLSFGKALLDNETAIASFLQTPPDRFFLETDDADIDIAIIYKTAAALRKTDEETIILQAQNNFQKLFGLYE